MRWIIVNGNELKVANPQQMKTIFKQFHKTSSKIHFFFVSLQF